MPRSLVAIGLALCVSGLSAQPVRDDILAAAVKAGEGTWRGVERLDGNLTSRSLFQYAFVLCETRTNLERLPRLLELAVRMQDRDPGSPTLGNSRWQWSDGAVLDANAVDFCMQYGVLLWLRHRDLPAAALRQELAGLLDYGIQGALRHRVPASYTNIALMNAGNLILLGEALDRPDVSAEGRRRLDAFCVYTAETGVHEYGSPTYYGVDLECLLLLHRFTCDAAVRSQADALLRLFWEMLAGTWYAPAQRLGGAHSRDYDYQRGLGALDGYLASAGWLDAAAARVALPLVSAFAEWQPAAELRQRNAARVPRWVVQTWGVGKADTCRLWATPDVALGSAGAGYGGGMDLPLTIDFAQPRQAVRTYFIADARRDPYGRKRIPAGGGHEKTLHLNPFWAAVQDRGEALALVLYRSRDLPENPPTLESHVVCAADMDEIRIAGQSIGPERRAAGTAIPLEPGQVLAVRRGRGAWALRVPWSRTMAGAVAPAALIFDASAPDACRLTVAHHSLWGDASPAVVPGAAFWVRVASDLAPERFAAWVADFAAAGIAVTADAGRVRLAATGSGQPLVIDTSSPFRGCTDLAPDAGRPVFAVDGEDLGAALLAALPVVRGRGQALSEAAPVPVSAAAETVWEAEQGTLRGSFVAESADDAFGQRFVWAPGEAGAKGGGDGTATWRLRLDQAGRYYLWARVQAPTPDDDSFFVRLSTPVGEPVGTTAWHLGTHREWEWVPFRPEDSEAGLALPAGDVFLELSVREDGARVDRLLLTTNPTASP